jgi:hypothetical protein
LKGSANAYPDGALDDVGVELDQAVSQEALEDLAPGNGVADGLGQLRLARDARQVVLPEGEQPGHDGRGDGLPRGGAGRWILAAHLSLKLPEFGQANWSCTKSSDQRALARASIRIGALVPMALRRALPLRTINPSSR